MKKNIVFLVIGILFLITFAVFTLIAKFDLLTQIDYDLTVKIQNHIPQRLNQLFSFLSLLGRFDVVAIVLVIYMLRLKKKFAGLLALCLFAAAHVVELIGKLYLDHPGPPFMFYRQKNALLFPELYVVGSSYPSGHSLRALFMAVLLSYALLHLFKKNWTVRLVSISCVWAVAASIAFGKIVLGQHWSSDVVGGSLLGVSFGFLSLFFIHYKTKPPHSQTD